MDCPDPIALEAFLAGEGDEAGRARIESHLRTCADCRERTSELSDNLDLISRAREILPPPDAPATPETVGPFRILSELGRGGMGVVYLAEQTTPRRRVALKLLREGIASPGVLHRFEREADALARLRHPAIARVLESGVARAANASGWSEARPWIAMELSTGRSIDRWIAESSPSLVERVELLAEVAEAIHHAHLNGVIHRDLKPGNVLVETRDDGAHPKILDFGIARTMEADGSRSLETEVGHVLGTLPFMSPEQVTGDPGRINAKTDIHALGVLSYWVFSGALPYAVEECSLPEAARIIHEDTPQPLSSVRPDIPGDLETIVHKCLEKDPERRYASADGVAEDLRRYLSDEPILARPPSAAYTMRKFVRRHRPVVALVATIVAGAILAGIVGTSLALRAQRAESEARASLDQAEAINRFLVGMLSSANPEFEGDRETTVREVLDNAADELASGELTEHPVTEARLRRVLGNTYGILGRYDEGEHQLREALAVVQRPDVDDSPFAYLNDLGLLIKDLRRFDEAESLFLAAADVARAANDRRNALNAISNAAAAVIDAGDYARGETLLVAAIQTGNAEGLTDDRQHTTNQNNLGVLRLRGGDAETAEAMLRPALAASRKAYGPEHPATLGTRMNLGTALSELGRFEEAEEHLRGALTSYRDVLGPQSLRVADCSMRLAEMLERAGREDEAITHYREALGIFESIDATDPRAARVRTAIRALAGDG